MAGVILFAAVKGDFYEEGSVIVSMPWGVVSLVRPPPLPSPFPSYLLFSSFLLRLICIPGLLLSLCGCFTEKTLGSWLRFGAF